MPPTPDRDAPAASSNRSDGSPRTLSEKVWDRHVVHLGNEDEPDIIFVDLHLVHEVTSPQAFDGLRMAGRRVHRPDLTVATADHNVPTIDIDKPVADPSRPSNWPCWRPTVPSSASPATPWATPTRASSTSSGPSRA